MKKKAIALFSGGLDSILAIKLMQEQDVEIIGLNFRNFLSAEKSNNDDSVVASGAKMLGIDLRIIDADQDYLDLLMNPKYGYGKNYNPCIDCKIHIFSLAKKLMQEEGASFVFTGDVLGERPMSQTKSPMQLIENQSGLKGLVVRPLCAKLLEPTLPEKEGIIDREQMLDISGRSRKPQYELVEKYSVEEFPSPAGGCLLTEKSFSIRIEELLTKNPESNITDVRMLRYGRHFRLENGDKVIVGRRQHDNEKLRELADDDNYIVLRAKEIPGPSVILKRNVSEETIQTGCEMTAAYAKHNNQDVAVYYDDKKVIVPFDETNTAEKYVPFMIRQTR